MAQSSNGFPLVVNNQPAPAEAGDFCSANPRAVVLAGAAQFVAPASGVLCGQFVWCNADTGDVSQSYKPGYQLGFVKRTNDAVIVNFLAEASFTILSGFPLTLYSQGEFWAEFDAGATPGQLVYADSATGRAVAGAAGGINTFVGTGQAGFVGTGTVVNLSTTLTVNTVTNGVLAIGDTVTGTDIPAATTIVAQLTGSTPGGTGTYQMSAAATGSAGPEAVTSHSTVLDLTAVASGTLEVGDTITGTGIAANTTITGQLSGTPGGVGLYRMSGTQQAFASAANVDSGAIATPWIVNSVAGNGELAQISTWG